MTVTPFFKEYNVKGLEGVLIIFKKKDLNGTSSRRLQLHAPNMIHCQAANNTPFRKLMINNSTSLAQHLTTNGEETEHMVSRPHHKLSRTPP
jgi:hypothetical protein